ncbi:MAG: YebC/PmpR family DNA-binding transcriptional regulator [Chloroflexi bacterium]|nr:YebC/PmpR family DNA-binding transcriptional regulator [Chloroflexota bacterium]
MSGHSKWSQIKRQKGANDAKRGQLFTKLGREISVSAREGGPDPAANFRLRLAVEKARDANMPMENIQRAIQRASGGAGGETFEEVLYEGYGPGGAALLIEVNTDNRNRTAAEVRATLTRGGGSLGEAGSVAWQFEPKGIIAIELDGADGDALTLEAIEAGAEDVNTGDNLLEVYTEPADLHQVRERLQAAKAKIVSAERGYVPKASLALDNAQAEQVLRLMERLEDLDDVQRVHTNIELNQAVLESVASG